MSKLLLMLLLLCTYLTRLEVTGCHGDREVRLQPGALPQEANLSPTDGVLCLSGFPGQRYVRGSGFNTYLQWWILPGS